MANDQNFDFGREIDKRIPDGGLQSARSSMVRKMTELIDKHPQLAADALRRMAGMHKKGGPGDDA